MAATFSAPYSTSNYHHINPPQIYVCPSFSREIINCSLEYSTKGLRLSLNNKRKVERVKAVNGERVFRTTSWDEKPFEILPDGKKVYLDEQDVVTYLDPPNELFPLDPSSYNPATYLWKKISDIPEGRRHRLLYLLNPRLISAAWDAAGTRYDNAKLAKLSSSSLLSPDNATVVPEFWNCHKSGGSIPLALISHLQKVLFRVNGKLYGRIIGGSTLARIATSFRPLYFTVKEVHQVMPTEQPCDLTYEFGDGLLNLLDRPEGFPEPAKHPWPFSDQVVIYCRHVGPGVMVGQAWQEGLALEQVPKKLCGEILMVKDYSTSLADGR